MKSLKILLTVLLTIVIVIVGFAAEILALVDITVLNPWFYTTALKQVGLYENIRTVLINQIYYAIDEQEGIPENFKDDAYDIVDTVLNQNRFEDDMSGLLGGTVNFVLYGNGDPDIPFQVWVNDLNQGLKDSGLVEEIVDYQIESGVYEEERRQEIYDAYYSSIKKSYTGFLSIPSNMVMGTTKLSEIMKIYAPTKEIQDRFESRFWQFRTWTTWANIGVYICFGIVLVMIACLFILWRKKSGVVFKLVGIVLIVNSATFILTGIGMLMSVTIASLLKAIPYILLPYVSFAQSLINPIALIALGTGIIVLVIGIVITVIGGALIRKKADSAEPVMEDTIEPEVNEIEYSNDESVEIITEPEDTKKDDT